MATDSPQVVEDEFETARRLRRVLEDLSRRFVALQRTAVAENGELTATHRQILEALRERSPTTLSELGRRLQLDKAWVSRNVDALTSRGLIDRHRRNADRRSLWLSLTDEGRVFLTRLDERLDGTVRPLVAGLGPVQCAEVEAYLQRLIEAMD